MKTKSVVELLGALLAICYYVVAQSTYPLPGPCIGPACHAPAHTLDYQDFTLIRRRSDGTYFRFSKSNHTGLGIAVASAPAFRGPWVYAFEILAGQLKSPIITNRSDTDLWSPEIHFANGQYYLFYSVHIGQYSNSRNHFDISVATSPSMNVGTWTDHGSIGLPAAPKKPRAYYVRIGPSLIANSSDPQGSIVPPFLTFGSGNWGIDSAILTPDLLKMESGSRVTEVLADQPSPPPGLMNKTEAGYQLQHGNYSYLFYSIGQCCDPLKSSFVPSAYRLEVCRRNALSSLSAPYLDRDGNDCATDPHRKGTVVLAGNPDGTVFGPGSVGATNDPDEGLVMFYQYRNATEATTTGMKFGWNYLTFDEDGWPKLVAQKPKR